MSEEEEIASLAELAGVLPAYHDQTQRLIETPLHAKRAVLQGLGFPTRTAAERAHARDRLRALREAPTPRVFACEAGAFAAISLKRSLRGRADWSIETEADVLREGTVDADAPNLGLPPLPAGYHRLTLRLGSTRCETLVVAAPARCWQPPEMSEGRRGFGLTAQIYGLRSARQFGIGDYTDVGDLAEGAARWGASFLGLSPAHALFPADPRRFSPYSPSSRLFLQTPLIDPSALAEEAPGEIARLLEKDGLAARLAELRAAPLIDYAKVWTLKREIFEALWTKFGGLEGASFAAFRRERGEALEQHATFDALSELFAQDGALGSDAWPQAYRSADSPEATRFRRENPQRIAFHAWLQWIADRQLASAHARARQAGMAIGVYRDLAVGADRAGSEAWSAPSRYLERMSIGAPPDPLGPKGQDWGLPPFDPLALEDKELRPFRDLVSANMRHAGALRIDHAFQLRRLFLIPVGGTAASGAYVAYPLDALLGVLRIESHRAKCLVIAEDLGTAPRGFSQAIMRAGVLSYRLLSFERAKTGGFTPPSDYPREALAAVSTHDLPTLKGWWRGLDVDLRECFGVFDAELAAEERAARARDRRRLVEALRSERLPAGAISRDSAPPMEGCLRFLARTPSALAAVQVEDAIGETQQANLPGPSDGHPNWRRRLSLDVEAIVAPGGPLARTAAALAREGRGFAEPARRLAYEPPRATYRLQLNKEFGFDQATAIVPYLRDLGVSHVYASPIAKAAPGSTHGYDVNDYAQINPELGGEAAFLRFSDSLREHGLGLIVDFVPNHMGVAGSGNSWWISVLEWGEASPHAGAFDIDFRHPASAGKVLLPVLAKPYAAALMDGDLALRFDAEAGAFFFSYFDQRFPVRPDLYPEILRAGRGGARAAAPLLDDVVAQFGALSAAHGEDLLRASSKAKARLAQAAAQKPALRRALTSGLSLYEPSREEGRRELARLLERQSYRLGFWRLASRELNYRRFFDVSTLAGVRAEDESVFVRMHELLFGLVRQGRIQGIRLDHIDGLADPAAYLDRLQSALGPGFYVIVEKILERGEPLRDWPIAGSTGYEILAALDQIFVDRDHAGDFDKLYREAAGDETPYEEQLVAIKASVLTEAFGGELANLTRELHDLAARRPLSLDLDDQGLRSALIALIAAFPVYRTYACAQGANEEDRRLLAQAADAARLRLDAAARPALDFIVEAFAASEPTSAQLRATIHFQQLTGPLMAKSLEDTLFYRYGRLIALNEVGGDPSRFGEPLAAFHADMARRVRTWPAALTATATHDTKRGEDARARLLAATSSPGLWRDAWNVFLNALAQASARPDARDSYLLFQSLIAAMPLELLERPDDMATRRTFLERLRRFVGKALREAKRRTSWTDPDEAYETAALRCLDDLFEQESGFLREISPAVEDFARRGAELAVARVVLKCALPGVPDFYQGTEFWDFSFVDPDNRRPVDYEARRRALADRAKLEDLSRDWRDGRIKQATIARMLADRAANPDLYAFGDYRSVALAGAGERRFIAFERRHGDDALLVVAATRFGALGKSSQETTRLPPTPGRWRNLLNGETLQITTSSTVEKILGSWPALALRKIS